MIKHQLFTINEKTGSVISFARKHCLMTTLSPEGKKNVIHCVDPFIRFADGACMVWYTEHYSTRFKKENHGKRMIVLLGEIIEARTWDHYQAHPSR